MFPEFLYHPHLSLQVKGMEFSAPGYRLVFLPWAGRHEELRISSPRKMVSCFAMMFGPLWKFLAMNITLISGACSLTRQK
jgi:hypothetical protein